MTAVEKTTSSSAFARERKLNFEFVFISSKSRTIWLISATRFKFQLKRGIFFFFCFYLDSYITYVVDKRFFSKWFFSRQNAKRLRPIKFSIIDCNDFQRFAYKFPRHVSVVEVNVLLRLYLVKSIDINYHLIWFTLIIWEIIKTRSIPWRRLIIKTSRLWIRLEFNKIS